jgi:hypothetical protein
MYMYDPLVIYWDPMLIEWLSYAQTHLCMSHMVGQRMARKRIGNDKPRGMEHCEVTKRKNRLKSVCDMAYFRSWMGTK